MQFEDSGSAAVAPGLGVADLLGGVACLQLTKRVADRGECNFDALIL
jgi:hypothetical protein